MPRINRMWLENDPYRREISYDTDGLLSTLKSSRDLGGRISSYEYEDRILMGGSAGVTVDFLDILLNVISGPFAGNVENVLGSGVKLFGSFQAEWVRPLVEMEAPGQGRISTVYDQKTFSYGTVNIQKLFGFIPTTMALSLNLEQRLYPSQVRVTDLDSKQTKNTNYIFEVGNSILNQPYVLSCTINEDLRRTTYNYTPIIRTRYRYCDQTFNSGFGDGWNVPPVPFPTYYVQDDVLGFNTKVEIFEGESKILVEQLLIEEINPNTFRHGREVTLKGQQKRVREFNCDNWGNCIREFDSGGSFEDPGDDLEIHTRYSNAQAPALNISGLVGSPFPELEINGRIHDRPETRVVLAQTPIGVAGTPTTHLIETHYRYHDNGQLIEDATWHEERWLRNKYAYHPEHASIVSHQKADGSMVLFEYDSHGQPAKTIFKEITDVDGEAEDLVLEFGHDYATGLKLWEKDGRGYVTEYRYDQLGRQITTIFPDEDDDLAWDPRTGSSSARANNPQETVHFDDEANSSTVRSLRK